VPRCGEGATTGAASGQRRTGYVRPHAVACPDYAPPNFRDRRLPSNRPAARDPGMSPPAGSGTSSPDHRRSGPSPHRRLSRTAAKSTGTAGDERSEFTLDGDEDRATSDHAGGSTSPVAVGPGLGDGGDLAPSYAGGDTQAHDLIHGMAIVWPAPHDVPPGSRFRATGTSSIAYLIDIVAIVALGSQCGTQRSRSGAISASELSTRRPQSFSDWTFA
jgi:hypothetical protein